MLKAIDVKIEDIYVPTDRRKGLDQSKIDAIVEEMMDGAPERPIRVRMGKDRYVLIEGVHRLEASKAVGEETISAFVVQARKF